MRRRVGHPAFEQLRAFAAHDTRSADRDRIAGHLGACASCRGEVVVMRTVVEAATDASYVPPVPAGAWDRIVARRAAGERAILPVGEGEDLTRGARSSTVARRRIAIASALLLGLAGIAAAVTTPAIREWMARRLWRDDAAAAPVKATMTPADSAAGSGGTNESAAFAGVTVPVSDRELWVAIDGADPALRIRVRLTGERDLDVRATGAAMTAVFKPRADGVGVTDAGPGEIVIDLPRSVARFVLRVDGRAAVAKEGTELRVLTSSVDTVGTDLVVSPRREAAAPRPSAIRRR
jgi:hypothetical protein